MSKEIVVRRVAIVPTTKCSLNCKHCGEFLFGPVVRKDVAFEDVCADIDACFNLIDHVTWFQFVGGEVYVYKHFADLLNYAQKYRDRFDKLIIETNATVAPDPAEREAMMAYGKDLFVFISNYGELSRAYNDFVEFFDEAGIEYDSKKYYGEHQYFNGWIDNTNPKHLNEPGDVLEVNAKNCPQSRIRNIHVYDGQLHRCSNSLFMTNMGLFPPKAGDFVDLRDKNVSREEKREIISKMYDHARESCKYCKQKYMDILPRVPAAQQMER